MEWKEDAADRFINRLWSLMGLRVLAAIIVSILGLLILGAQELWKWLSGP